MKNIKLKIKILIAVIVLMILIALVAFYMGTRYEGPIRIGAAQITADVINAKFDEASELVTEVYYYTSMGTFQNNLMFKDWNIPLTSKTFIVSYNGIIKAGIDLSKVNVFTEGYEIFISLPDAKVLSHEIDQDSVQVLDEKTNLFNPIKVEDVTGFEAEQKAGAEERALSEGLLDRANEGAETAIRDLLMTIDGMKNYSITFR